MVRGGALLGGGAQRRIHGYREHALASNGTTRSGARRSVARQRLVPYGNGTEMLAETASNEVVLTSAESDNY